jgi:putative transposase
MACMKPGRPGRFFYRVRVHRRRMGDRASMSEADYAALVTAAHHALKAPVVLELCLASSSVVLRILART